MRLLPVIAIAFLSGLSHLNAALSIADRDRAQFDANAPRKGANRSDFPTVKDSLTVQLVASPLMLLVLPEDDCGACSSNSPIINPAIGRIYYPSFSYTNATHSGTRTWTNGFWRAELLVSTNLVQWEIRRAIQNDYVRSGEFAFKPFYDDSPCLYQRLKIRVTP